MGVLGWLREVTGSWRWTAAATSADADHAAGFGIINPATGLPMTGSGTTGVDVAGNPYGVDLHHGHAHGIDPFGHDHWRHHDLFGHG